MNQRTFVVTEHRNCQRGGMVFRSTAGSSSLAVAPLLWASITGAELTRIVHHLHVPIKPTISYDDFAKVLGQFETLDAVRTEVRNQLASAKEADSRRALEDKIIGALLARHEFGIPDDLAGVQISGRTDRAIIRDEAPDILLTNYKMLDQLLLRYEDRAIWQQSAGSLGRLVKPARGSSGLQSTRYTPLRDRG